MRFLSEQKRGFPTAAGPIPIVPAAIIFDLAVGRAVSPSAEDGYAACLAAVDPETVERGAVGAGIGARFGLVDQSQPPRQGGFGAATVQTSVGAVSAYLVVNAAGEIITPDLDIDVRDALLTYPLPGEGRESTTIGVVVTNAEVDHRTLERMTIAAHDGMARMIRPCHTPFDGDAIFTVGLRQGTVDLRVITLLSIATELAVERAILDAVMMR
jgi:L-aminopeptidase/D-esterase-like protein